MHLKKQYFMRESGASEVIGAIMLISVVVVAVALIGVALTSQGTPQKIPALDAIISNVDRNVSIYHNGGDSLSAQNMYVLVNGARQVFSKNNDPGWTTWSVGESLKYEVPGISPISSVQVVYDNSGSSAILSSAIFGVSGMPTSVPTHTITASAGAGGSISPSGSITISDGSSQTFTITPSSGYHVASVVVDSVPQGAISSYPFMNVVGDHVISASFAIDLPTFGSIAPAAGPIAGSTPVTITGTGFTGATAVTFGGTAATTFTVNSATQITATTPAHAAGVVNVVITTPSGPVTGTSAYTYSSVPTFGSIAPAAGPIAGSTPVTITGTGFTGATAVTFSGTAATAFTVNSATQITATTPAHAAGVVNVVVTTPGGPVTGTSAYTYTAVPTFTSIAPAAGKIAGGTSVTITGTGFTGATAVTLDGIPATGVSVVSGNSITATTPAHAAGAVDVVITTPNGTATGPGAYTYAAVPTFTSIAPSIGTTLGGTAVTITGTGFTGATAVTLDGIPATGITVVSDTSITATTPFNSAGPADVVVTTPGGSVTGLGAYTYTSTAAPTFTSIAPAIGPLAGGTAVTITGTNFASGGLFGVKIGGVAATITGTTTAVKITATTPPGSEGAQNVVITNNDGQTVTGTYTYAAVPTFTSIAPASGPLVAGTRVTITGTHFTGATAVTFGGTAATAITVISDTQIMATAPAKAAAGPVTVAVTAPGGTATGTYTYAAIPTFTSITPGYGRLLGGTTVIIAGGNFVNGATAVTFDGVAAPTFTVNSAAQITATTPPDVASTINVIVTTPGGTATKTYIYANPTISSITPATAARGGLVSITNLAGNYFQPGATVQLRNATTVISTGTSVVVVQNKITCQFSIPSSGVTPGTNLYYIRVTNMDAGAVDSGNIFSIT